MAAVVLLVIGFFKNINLVMLLAYALLALLILNRLTGSRGLTRLLVHRRIPQLLFARTPALVEVQVSNPTRFPRVGLGIEDKGPEHLLRWFAVRLDRRGQERFRQEVVLPRRGRYAWGPVAVVGGAPFGLVQCRLELAPGEEVIVLPCLGRLDRGRFHRFLLSLSPRGDRIRQRPQNHPAAQAEFHGLRPFRTGDSPRLIHWRTSARRGELMVREFEDVPSENLLVVLDPTLPPGRLGEKSFEEAIRLAATLCWTWCQVPGDRLTLATAGPEPRVLDGLTGPFHARHVLECLAVQEPASHSDPAPLIDRLHATGLSAAAVVVVSVGHSSLAAPLEQALKRPVNCLDASKLSALDFYEQTEPDA
jgi:uncharacterized protein (DUF58 family)